MSNPRKIRAKRNLKRLVNRRFRVIMTRDTTESTIVEIEAVNRATAADNALDWANGRQEATEVGGIKVVQPWADDENTPKRAYLGDPDRSAFGGRRTIKGSSVQEIS